MNHKDIIEPKPPVRKCPKCGQMTLQFDLKTGRMHCTNCGFEQKMPVAGNIKKIK